MLNKRSFSAFVGLSFLFQGTVFAEPLITAEEAALPAAPAGLVTRGISRGPGVKLLSPNVETGNVKAPFDFKVAFEPHGGNKVDAASVKVTYLKSPFVDLTPRLQKSISDTGINFSEANVPAGEHDLKITVLDIDGRETNSTIHLVVAP